MLLELFTFLQQLKLYSFLGPAISQDNLSFRKLFYILSYSFIKYTFNYIGSGYQWLQCIGFGLSFKYLLQAFCYMSVLC